MRIWKINKLVEEIKNNRLTQDEKFSYFITFFIIWILLSEFYKFMPEDLGFYSILDSILYTVISIVGLIICFRTNSQGDNINFLERFICISVPITIRLIAIIFIFYIIYFTIGYSIEYETFDKFTEYTNWVDLLFNSACMIYLYSKIKSSIKLISINQ